MNMDTEQKNISEKLVDLELAKKANNSKVRKYLPAVVFVATFFYSSMIALGLATGYFGSQIYMKLMVETGKINPVYIKCGKNWSFHLHHWITGGLLLLAAWLLDFFYLPRFFLGVVFGIMAHDIYDYNDWHKVLVKNEENQK